MILQLQSNNKDQLTAADVEAIVYRIVGQETSALKANIEGASNEALLHQVNSFTKELLFIFSQDCLFYKNKLTLSKKSQKIPL